MLHQLHVIKVLTKELSFLPYSHYRDEGHNPHLEIKSDGTNLVLECNDLFKLKNNYQSNPQNRMDIYMPYYTALNLGTEILRMFGEGKLAQISWSDPDAFRKGPQTLPLIEESRQLEYLRAGMKIGEQMIYNELGGRIFVDREKPNAGHVEMEMPEVHLGLELNFPKIPGCIDKEGKKSYGKVKITLDKENAQNLAQTLLYYANK